ncbi:helix-turn-helix transcriptional regulator [Actinoplanes sp. LDG1-06]|uniref:Helix-turn-helix transcriptional regulator n=1 Tax=Paractinoplanes ovalisporus TaxID=2810368 RepID=A0ABS2AGP8_9ACTN|nr:helix-turn-helix transcriptional regulator [Actinoplanes ovalisporus]MBM2618999.1 helix-turn-helix transcriptional regulator [Actinoplanes ovalisporus]
MRTRKTPTVRRRRLAADLFALRIDAGLTREQVNERTGISEGALFKMERGKTRPQPRTLRALLDLYGIIDQARRDEMEAILRRSDEVGWIQPFEGNLVDSYATLISFESEAERQSVFELTFIPGLLQTPEYARTIITTLMPDADQEAIDRRVEVRMRRQESKSAVWAILDEGVIRRNVGGCKVMQGQLEHLLTAAGHPSVTLQIMPYASGAHLGMPGSFLILEFAEPDPAIVYTEHTGGGLFLEHDAAIARYRDNFQRLAAQASSPADTIRLIQDAASAARKGAQE